MRKAFGNLALRIGTGGKGMIEPCGHGFAQIITRAGKRIANASVPYV
jgi:hypothetical protein